MGRQALSRPNHRTGIASTIYIKFAFSMFVQVQMKSPNVTYIDDEIRGFIRARIRTWVIPYELNQNWEKFPVDPLGPGPNLVCRCPQGPQGYM